MGAFVDWIKGEWGVISRAPLTFMVGAILISTATWGGATAFYKEEVTAAHQERDAAGSQRDEARQERAFWKEKAQTKQIADNPPTPSGTQPRGDGSSSHLANEKLSVRAAERGSPATLPAGAASKERAIADLMKQGDELREGFIEVDNTEQLTTGYSAWYSRVYKILSVNFDDTYAVQFSNAHGSAWMGCPVGHMADGCGIYNEIAAKDGFLSGLLDGLRKQSAISVGGQGNVVSVNQTGGTTAYNAHSH